MLCEVEEGGGLEIKEMSERKELVSEKKITTDRLVIKHIRVGYCGSTKRQVLKNWNISLTCLCYKRLR